ncbi:hypothetical protein G6F63_016893 [Rhizopus arrhizus]|nr:hypothetical protein G6F63_016893 [Rhizopus arrhizus]
MQFLHVFQRRIAYPHLAVGNRARQVLDHPAPGDLHAGGHLFLGQAIETAEHEGFALALGQFGHRVCQALQALALCGELQRAL